ncbi:MAG: MBL fold metallo-hydrolase [Oscillospiraceae bacterium]|nr:MBL fold metallo-hydrolase [Candidatus Equicaccousia limihippi]
MDKERRKKAQKRKKTVIILSVFVAVLLCATGVFFTIRPDLYGKVAVLDNTDAQNYIKFIDCGAADCMLIKSGGSCALIDTGDIKDNAQAVLASLDKSDISSIDYMFISHPHSDHIGGVAKILEKYKVDYAVIPPITEFTAADTELATLSYKALCEQCDCETVKAGQSYQIGEFSVDIIYYSTEFDDINDHSAVYKISAFGKTLLSMGDSGFETEDELLYAGLNVKADIYKLSHHGSDTANDYGFIQAVDPNVIICSAEKSQYLDGELSEMAKSFNNTEIFSTYNNGDITITFGKNGYEVKCDK